MSSLVFCSSLVPGRKISWIGRDNGFHAFLILLRLTFYVGIASRTVLNTSVHDIQILKARIRDAVFSETEKNVGEHLSRNRIPP